jgi:hypothetical protein
VVRVPLSVRVDYSNSEQFENLRHGRLESSLRNLNIRRRLAIDRGSMFVPTLIPGRCGLAGGLAIFQLRSPVY